MNRGEMWLGDDGERCGKPTSIYSTPKSDQDRISREVLEGYSKAGKRRYKQSALTFHLSRNEKT